MPRSTFVERPRRVLAEQYLVATNPEPTGICHCDFLEKLMAMPPNTPHVHGEQRFWILEDGDWILEHLWSHAFSVVKAPEFADRFADGSNQLIDTRGLSDV